MAKTTSNELDQREKQTTPWKGDKSGTEGMVWDLASEISDVGAISCVTAFPLEMTGIGKGNKKWRPLNTELSPFHQREASVLLLWTLPKMELRRWE
jgi:hypothetical protein